MMDSFSAEEPGKDPDKTTVEHCRLTRVPLSCERKALKLAARLNALLLAIRKRVGRTVTFRLEALRSNPETAGLPGTLRLRQGHDSPSGVRHWRRARRGLGAGTHRLHPHVANDAERLHQGPVDRRWAMVRGDCLGLWSLWREVSASRPAAGRHRHDGGAGYGQGERQETVAGRPRKHCGEGHANIRFRTFWTFGTSRTKQNECCFNTQSPKKVQKPGRGIQPDRARTGVSSRHSPRQCGIDT